MIIHGVMSMFLLCLLREARGVGVDPGWISYRYTESYYDKYLTFYSKDEEYPVKPRCTNCVKVDGARIFCYGGALVNVTVDLYKGGEQVYVPFNVSCDRTRNVASVEDITASAHPHSMRLSWIVSNGSIDKYIIHYMAERKYRYTAVMTRNQSFLLEGLKESMMYRICVATVDGRSETGAYRCKSQETDSLVTGPVNSVTVMASITSVAILWGKPQRDLYAPSSYTVDYRDPHSDSCGRIVVNMGTSGVTPHRGTPPGCELKRELTWTKLQPLTIDGLLPDTRYNITIMPVNRGKAQVPVTLRVRTSDGSSGKVANLRTTTISGLLRVEYDAPFQPNGAIIGYRVTVVLRRQGLCEQGGAQTLENTTVTATHHDVPLTSLTRCAQYDIAVAPINEGGVGVDTSIVFDYRPGAESDLPISNITATTVSSTLARISWEHRGYRDDCPKIGFLVEVAHEADAADCVSQIIYEGRCAQLTEMLRATCKCEHMESRSITNNGRSWVINIGALLRPSRVYVVRIWKISSAVRRQGAPLSLSSTDGGCFTDCNGRTYVGVRSHGNCTTRPPRADNICRMRTRSQPWCGDESRCDVPRCSLPSPATGCVRDVRQVTETSKTTLTWTPPPHGAPMIGVIALLHGDDGTCERSNLHRYWERGDEAPFDVAVTAFYVSCGNLTTVRGALNSTVFDNLHQNRRYRVYIVPLVSTSEAGEVRNVSVTTLLAKPDYPRSVTVTGRSTASLSFRWPKVTENAAYGPADRYEVELTSATTVVKAVTLRSEGASFSGLAECTEHCVTVYGANAAGRSKGGGVKCAYTLAPRLGTVEVGDIESGPRGQRVVAWRYSGRDVCPRSYVVRYRSKFMPEYGVSMETNDTSITLKDLARNTLYTVAVRAETRMDTEDGASEVAFSVVKEFYTGRVVPRIYGYKEDFTAGRERLNISWGFDSSGDGSVFEFILRLKNASDSCISTTHFICRSCPLPYHEANLYEGDQRTRQRLLGCSPLSVVEFTKDAKNLHRSLDIDVANLTFTVEIHAINLAGVHNVYGGQKVSTNSGSATIIRTVILSVSAALVVLQGAIAITFIGLYRHGSFSLNGFCFLKARKSQSTNIGGGAMSLIPPSE